ncbi:hypothetical protein [Microcoleus sp. B3-D7]|uniref:hypothetical protein n=1 Tax=Microcoleus sp. B3-D7 TaxID=2818659 RepID=UPI002FCF62F2
MKHVAILNIINENINEESKPHKSIVIEEPPMVLTWRGMFFLFTRKVAENSCTKYFYQEVYGCSLAAISTPEIVDDQI